MVMEIKKVDETKHGGRVEPEPGCGANAAVSPVNQTPSEKSIESKQVGKYDSMDVLLQALADPVFLDRVDEIKTAQVGPVSGLTVLGHAVMAGLVLIAKIGVKE